MTTPLTDPNPPQAFDSRAFALGGSNSTRFVPRAASEPAAAAPDGLVTPSLARPVFETCNVGVCK